MHIHCLGTSHNTANIHLREQLAFTGTRIEDALSQFSSGEIEVISPIDEMIILSTCNRVEIYAVSSEVAFESIAEFLTEVSGIPGTEFSAHTYQLLDEEVVDHLMRVSAGLDSLVLGEPQILGQVIDAFAAAQCNGSIGNILSRLFQAAIHAGKRARTETMISQNPASVASIAVMLVNKCVPDLVRANILVLGAGEMAELTVQALIKRGATNITVLNRTLERAQALAQRWSGSAATFDSLQEKLIETDILITSTGAPHTIITASKAGRAMAKRHSRPLVIMDIAVPRDVDPEVGKLPNISLFDMDTLALNLEEALAKRKEEVPNVEVILNEEKIEFMKYLTTLDVVPIISQMRKKANQIRQAELEKTIRRMRDLSPEEQERIEAMTKSIVSKILHNPTITLKSKSTGSKAAEYANVTRSLFGLD
jgi:glutamyl-tRNA reductase